MTAAKLEIVKLKPGAKPLYPFKKGDIFVCPKCNQKRAYYSAGLCRTCRSEQLKFKVTPEDALKILLADYQEEYDEICKMAEEDIRTVPNQAIWILVDYVRDHKRYEQREKLRNQTPDKFIGNPGIPVGNIGYMGDK